MFFIQPGETSIHGTIKYTSVLSLKVGLYGCAKDTEIYKIIFIKIKIFPLPIPKKHDNQASTYFFI
jgi:hypothetical protein